MEESRCGCVSVVCVCKEVQGKWSQGRSGHFASQVGVVLESCGT